MREWVRAIIDGPNSCGPRATSACGPYHISVVLKAKFEQVDTYFDI